MPHHLILEDFPPHPQCFRSVCESCGIDKREGVPVVQVMSVEVDHQDGAYTHLFLCGLCVQEWAADLGMLTVEDSEKLRQEKLAAEDRLVAAEAELAVLTPVREALEAIAAEAPRAAEKRVQKK